MLDADTLPIVRALMRALWQKYDSGGHSGGRSLQALLLEAVTFGWEVTGEFPPETLTFEFIEKIQEWPLGDQPDLFPEVELERVPQEVFLSLVFRRIQKIQRESFCSRLEEELVQSILHLLNASCVLDRYYYARGAHVDDRALIQEGRERARLADKHKRGPY